MKLRHRLARAERTPTGACRLCGETRGRLVDSAEWLDLQVQIVEALEPYPEAKLAVAEHLRRHT